MDVLRIGNASGYWGDDLSALGRQLEGGPIDVITMDFLAEITMSILQKQLARNPEMGYARDFVDQMRDVMELAVEKGVTIISNAGGVRPSNCLAALRGIAKEHTLDPRIGVITGDDILPQLDTWAAEGVDLSNMDDGRAFSEVAGSVSSANAYFGAAPVVRALELGAKIIVTGRVTDTGITVAPMMHRFGWGPDDHDQIAAGIIAGHILECGAQSTGGNFTDYRRVVSFDDIGYPICEMHADGSFVITKHEGTGGLVSVATVKEQLLYEMGDPQRYLTPDVIADFSSIQLESDGRNRVRIWGIRGSAPTDKLKVSMSYDDGFKASGGVIVCGPNARDKCEAFGEILWNRLPDYEAKLTEYVGANATWGPLSPSGDANEIFLRFGVRDHDRDRVSAFSKMLPALILSGPPGVAVTGGRPAIQSVVAYWPTLIPRDLCAATVHVSGGGGDDVSEELRFTGPTAADDARIESTQVDHDTVELSETTERVPLSRIAHGRSGDKGDTCNIGIIARHPSIYLYLTQILTADFVKSRFRGICRGEVERFEVPNLHALNFLLHESLGGGGTLSLHIDAQGKTYSHALLATEMDIDRTILEIADKAEA